MLFVIPDVLSAAETREFRRLLDSPDAPWTDGRVTSGPLSAEAKHNLQIPESSPLSETLGLRVLSALERCGPFLSAALPLKIYPPMFNRYGPGHGFGAHIDNTIRVTPSGERVRCDLSSTLFLSAPDEYDGGGLVIEEASAERRVKLPAGHMVLYSAGTRHRVEPVTRGSRVACFFWTQSMVRCGEKREILMNLDAAVQAFRRDSAGHPEIVRLTGVYHNLLRLWAEA